VTGRDVDGAIDFDSGKITALPESSANRMTSPTTY